MTMQEIKEQVSFLLGLPANKNVENLDIEKAVFIAFRELKVYMRTPVDKTVPYSTCIDLQKCEIHTDKVLYVQASQPRIGLTIGSLDMGNPFVAAASVGLYSSSSGVSGSTVGPYMRELARAQVGNCLSTDLQWKYDPLNQVVYCTHKPPKPAMVTVRYVPIFYDVSEIRNELWIDYLIRLSVANMKVALGRSRSKYRIEGSNVTLDGEILLSEGNAELEAIRSELSTKRNRLMVLQ